MVMYGRTAASPPTATTLSAMAPTARIAACGGTMMAVKASTPYMPRLLIVKVAPEMSPSCSRPARAPLGQLTPLCRNLAEARTIGVPDHGGHHRVGNRHREGHVYVGVIGDPVLRPAGVEPRVCAEGASDGRDQQIRVGEPHLMRAFHLGHQACARGIEGGCLDVARDEEVRSGRPTRRRPLGHETTNGADLLHGCAGRRGGRTRRGRGRPNIIGRNVAPVAGTAHAGEVDAKLGGQPARLGRHPKPSTSRCGHWCRRHRGSWRLRHVRTPARLGRRHVSRAGRLFSRLQQPTNGVAHRDDVAFLRGDPTKNAVALGFDFDHGLVGLDLDSASRLSRPAPLPSSAS